MKSFLIGGIKGGVMAFDRQRLRPAPRNMDEIDMIIWQAWPDRYCHCNAAQAENRRIRAGIKQRLLQMKVCEDRGDKIVTTFAGIEFSIPLNIWAKYQANGNDHCTGT